MSISYRIIELRPDGEGHATVDMGTVVIQIVTRFNYAAACWTMDILDTTGELMLAGLMLIPNIDILKPYTALKESLGSLVLIEKNAGDYMSPDLLGITTALLWFPPGADIVLPVAGGG
jgi:hypothetical protein